MERESAVGSTDQDSCWRCLSEQMTPDGMECTKCGWHATRCKQCMRKYAPERLKELGIELNDVCANCYSEALTRDFS